MPAAPTRRRFALGLTITLAVLLVVGGVGVAVSLGQGPRVSGIQLGTDALTEQAGQRLVFTTNQALAPVDPSQVEITPAAPFTLAASGRHLAVQFTAPLAGDSDYTVSVRGVQGISGGPSSTLEHRFRTPPVSLYLTQRRDDRQDALFSTNLAGDQAYSIFEDDRIEEARVAPDGIVVETSTPEGQSRLRALPRSTTAGGAAGAERDFTLPGAGVVDNVRVADHGGLVGYTFTAADVATNPDAITATLFIARLADPAAEPQRIDVGADARVVQWAFVPGTSSLLILTFDGQLRLVDTARPEADPVALGNALAISGVERGTAHAIVERASGFETIDLTTLDTAPLVEPAGAATLGIPGPITPDVGGATIRWFTLMGDDRYPRAQSVVRVDPQGAVQTLFTTDGGADSLLQVCPSPNGQYLAVTLAPDLVANPYDLYLRPLPKRVQTHIIEMATGTQLSVLDGSDASWCASSVTPTL